MAVSSPSDLPTFTPGPGTDVSRETASRPPWGEHEPVIVSTKPDPEFPGLIGIKFSDGTDLQYLIHPNGSAPVAGHKYLALSGGFRVIMFVPFGPDRIPVVLRVEPL